MRLVSLTALCLLAAPLAAQGPGGPPPQNDSLAQARARYVEALREAIKGREQEPAEAVFKNITTLKGVPAGRLLGQMDAGWSRALGVGCEHCHDPEAWDSDDKKAKLVSRDMVAMVQVINAEVRKIPNIRSENPTVNCGMCHRGQPRPGVSGR